MHITVNRCGMCFRMVSHVQQSVSSVRRMSKCMFEEVSKVSNTAPNLTSMFANKALLGVGLGLGFVLENKERSKEGQRHY